MMTKLKIAVITTDNREHDRNYSAATPYFGAAPEALFQGFKQIPDLEIHVIGCTQRPMKSPDKLSENTWFHSVHVPKIGWLRTGYLGCMQAVKRRLKMIEPDIVHGQGTERDCAVEAVFSGLPNVLTIHGNMAEITRLFRSSHGLHGVMQSKLETQVLKRTIGVFCNSEYTEKLVSPRAKRTWRVPNALRELFFAPRKPGSPGKKCTLLNVGLVSKRKRQAELLEAARRLHEQGLDFELHFIGAFEAGAYSARFRELLREAEAAGYARHLGMKSAQELVACLDAADGLVHCPSEEAFGLVVPEALARDVKFFGTRTGGIVDICAQVPGAELFDAEDWTGLTAAMADWIRAGHPKPSGAAEIMRKRYHPAIVAQRHLEIYREVLKWPFQPAQS